MMETDDMLHVCSYEDRLEGMDSLILMGESLCRVDPEISLRLTAPNASVAVSNWARGWPEVTIRTETAAGLDGWDVKPWLLLQELKAGAQEAVWIDSDVIITRSVSQMLREFPSDNLIVAEEWDRHNAIPVAHQWGWPAARPVQPVNSCFLRVTKTHQPLLEYWLKMTQDSRYREAQRLPFERRPWHLASDQVLLTALLSSEAFGDVSYDTIRIGRHIAQCAGSSGYRPLHRCFDIFRGLPPLIHSVGRKPWTPSDVPRNLRGFLLDFATDVSPYVLASRRINRNLDINPDWLKPRTSLGALLRCLTAGHPALAGLPLAVIHAIFLRIGRMLRPNIIE